MTDDLLSRTLPTVIGGAVLLGATKLLLDDTKKGKKRKSMRLLDSVK